MIFLTQFRFLETVSRWRIIDVSPNTVGMNGRSSGVASSLSCITSNIKILKCFRSFRMSEEWEEFTLLGKMSKLEVHILSCANSLVEWRLLLRSEAASPTPPSYHQSRPGSESGLTARDFLKGFNVAWWMSWMCIVHNSPIVIRIQANHYQEVRWEPTLNAVDVAGVEFFLCWAFLGFLMSALSSLLSWQKLCGAVSIPLTGNLASNVEAAGQDEGWRQTCERGSCSAKHCRKQGCL